MKIMVIDRDRGVADEIESLCKSAGNIGLTIEPIKNKAIESLKNNQYDAVFFDPAPQNDELRTFVIGARRGNPNYTPIVAMSHNLSLDEAQSNGTNDFIQKPFNSDVFIEKLENMHRLVTLNQQLSDESEDFPSRDGIISKSAFNQIFISCLDRADRYGEATYLMFSTIKNIEAIRANHGDETAALICENLKKYTMRIRRVSDIAGRSAQHQICLMLLRPTTPDEPKMAVSRFAESMAEYAELISTKEVRAVVTVSMMELPTGHVIFSKDFE